MKGNMLFYMTGLCIWNLLHLTRKVVKLFKWNSKLHGQNEIDDIIVGCPKDPHFSSNIKF